MRDLKQVGSKGQTLLSGILRCGVCGGNMLQVTKKFYGCYTNHRKSPTLCSNNRMVNCRKIEGKIIEVIKQTLLDPRTLDSATKRLNEKIKTRLRAAPEELKSLERKLTEAEREIQNLLKFVMTHGESSTTIRDSLSEKETEVTFYRQQILSFKTANVDRLLVTPLVLRERFQKLAELFESDPILANAALRKLIPDGLSCRPMVMTTKKNLNQNNSRWCVIGELAVGQPTQADIAAPTFVPPNRLTMTAEV